VVAFVAALRLGESDRRLGITLIVNGLEDDDHAKSPNRKEVRETFVILSVGFQGHNPWLLLVATAFVAHRKPVHHSPAKPPFRKDDRAVLVVRTSSLLHKCFSDSSILSVTQMHENPAIAAPQRQ
jgi:hypothetical protein